jgi:hypothetical protein
VVQKPDDGFIWLMMLTSGKKCSIQTIAPHMRAMVFFDPEAAAPDL